MRKSQLISQVILTSGLATDKIAANRIFVQTFVEHHDGVNLQQWDTELPPHVAETFLRMIGSGKEISVRHMINDLDLLVKKMN